MQFLFFNDKIILLDKICELNGDNIFIGSCISANLDGYIDDTVVVDLSIFDSVPSKEKLDSLYERYLDIMNGEVETNTYTEIVSRRKVFYLGETDVTYSNSDAKLRFMQYMNDKAKEIGMENTVFENPHGLDEKTKNYSTAYDMALLMRYANSLPMFREITGTKKKTVKTDEKTYVWSNKNKLLYTYKYITGGKTGYTEKANRTLVTSASKNNMNLIVVTLNDGNDFENHKELYEYGFNNYSMEKVFDKDKMKLSKNSPKTSSTSTL